MTSIPDFFLDTFNSVQLEFTKTLEEIQNEERELENEERQELRKASEAARLIIEANSLYIQKRVEMDAKAFESRTNDLRKLIKLNNFVKKYQFKFLKKEMAALEESNERLRDNLEREQAQREKISKKFTEFQMEAYRENKKMLDSFASQMLNRDPYPSPNGKRISECRRPIGGFVGRKDLLKKLNDFCVEHNKDCLLLLHGASGLGKTETALQFAYEQGKEYQLVWLFDCSSDESLNQSYRNLAEELNLFVQGDELDTIVKKVHDRLRSRESNFLLIYDNVKSSILLPNSKGVIIATSQKNGFWPHRGPREEISVSPFDLVECKALLGNDIRGSEDDLKALREELGGFPVLIKIAKKQISENGLSLREYLEEIEKEEIHPFNKSLNYEDYPLSLMQLYNPELNKLKSDYLAVFKMLIMCTYLHSGKIHKSLFSSFLRKEKMQPGEVFRLLENIYITHDQESFSVHRFLLPVLQKDKEDHLFFRVISLLVEQLKTFDENDLTTYKVGENCEVHVEAIANDLPPSSPENLKLLSDLFLYMGLWKQYSQSDLVKAMQYYEKSLKLREIIYKKGKHLDIAECYYHLGVCYALIGGDLKKPLDFHEKSKMIRLEQYEKAETEKEKKASEKILLLIADNTNWIGNCYHDDWQKALEFHNKALDMRKKALNCQSDNNNEFQNHPDIAKSLNNIGTCHFRNNKYEEALGYFEKAYKIDLTVFKGDHPHVARDLYNISSCKIELNKYAEAIKEGSDSLRIYKSIFKNDYCLEVVRGIYRLGFAKQGAKLFEEALMHYEEALNIAKTMDNKTFLLDSLRGKGDCLYHLSMYNESFHAFKEAYIKAINCEFKTKDGFISSLFQKISVSLLEAVSKNRDTKLMEENILEMILATQNTLGETHSYIKTIGEIIIKARALRISVKGSTSNSNKTDNINASRHTENQRLICNIL